MPSFTHLSGDLESQPGVLHPPGLGLLEPPLAGQEDGGLLLEGALSLGGTQTKGTHGGRGRKEKKKPNVNQLSTKAHKQIVVVELWRRRLQVLKIGGKRKKVLGYMVSNALQSCDRALKGG